MSAACPSLPISPCTPLAEPTRKLHRIGPQRRHPVGFYVLCLAVACERGAAYTLSALAVLMLAERYGYSRAEALRIVSLVSAASYLGTVPAGRLTDKVIGPHRALSTSAALLAVGYAALIWSSPLALILSLAFIIAGSALFKPSTQAVLMGLLPSGDARVEAAQIGFYMAVNAGATLGALAAGLLAREGGWGAPFALAAALMLAARFLLTWFRADLLPRPRAYQLHRVAASSTQQRRNALTIAALIFAMLVYTVCFGQVEGSLLLWAQDRTDRIVLGFEVPAAWFVALPAVLVLMLGPVQLALLPWLQRRIGTHRLVAGGLISVALAFAILLSAAASATPRVSMSCLIGVMALLVVGELLVAPLGIALILRLTPHRHCGVVVGAWYVSGAIGFWLAGEIGAWSLSGTGLLGLLVLVLLPVAGAAALLVARRCDGR